MTGITRNYGSRSSSTVSSLGSNQHANRCRADSGSTYSSSDTSNRSKTSTRRRSHRPRGCRGGSSRKKRRGGKIPKEIVGNDISEETPVQVEVDEKIDPAVSSPVNKQNIYSQTKQTGHGPSRINITSTLGVVNEDTSKTPVYDENHGPLPVQQPFSSNKVIPLTSNAATHGINKQENTLTVKGKGSSLTPCLPPLQDNMKPLMNSRKENFHQSFQGQNHRGMERTGINNSTVLPQSYPQRQILPPMCHPEQQIHLPSQDVSFQRPNIYALQNKNTCYGNHNPPSSYNHINRDSMSDYNTYTQMEYELPNNNISHFYEIHNNSYGHYGAQQETKYNMNLGNSYGYANNSDLYEPGLTSFHAENRQEIVHHNNNINMLHKNVVKSSNIHNNYINHEINTLNNKVLDTSYRTERIEKQRQMMPHGGSLFVTSPKSFLMGWKGDKLPQL